jgi:hypothetical protein
VRFQSDNASVAPCRGLAADALTNAASLIHAPDALFLSASASVGQTVPAACGWAGSALLALVAPGPLPELIRAAGPGGLAVSAHAVRVTLDRDGWPQQVGRLDCHGTARPVPGWFLGHAALMMCHTHLHPGLVAAVANDGWLLLEFTVQRATWTGPGGVTDLAPRALSAHPPG